MLDDKVIGEVGLRHYSEKTRECELSVHMMNDSVKGKGYGTQAEQHEGFMIVRRFAEADAEEVSDLIIKTIRISNTKDYPVEMMEELIRHMQPEDLLARASRTHFYVIEENAVIAGCGGIGPYPDQEDVSFLFHIFVLPEYQGRGIGRLLVETLEKDAYALKAGRIELSASITGLQFYRRMGYGYKNNVTSLDEDGLYRLEKHR